MTQTKTQRAPATNKRGRTKQTSATQESDILTLEEAATYLRVASDQVLCMVNAQGLPGRQFGAEWRFLRSAVQDWLGSAASAARRTSFWQTHFGATKDDPYLEEMLAEIYRRRGRPEVEES